MVPHSGEFNVKHPLENGWTWWYDNPEKRPTQESWGGFLKEIYSFDSVEDFWSLWNNIKGAHELAIGCTYHVFKMGIEPMWESPENHNGGRWIFTLEPSHRTADELNTLWLNTILACIGNTFEEAASICGVVVNIRKSADKICIWTKCASDESKQRSIGFVPLRPPLPCNI
eukprot:TRINITY_DN9616_c0_g1_i14.p1 TRINITY_DN9616_c0_g1~~TRINITY_DN9616_c0_g1_i14.p1  ORF type:complete len:171 (-),score=18.73 TRINITY_DN9616_c0_g1_i14:495-1007(-)